MTPCSIFQACQILAEQFMANSAHKILISTCANVSKSGSAMSHSISKQGKFQQKNHHNGKNRNSKFQIKAFFQIQKLPGMPTILHLLPTIVRAGPSHTSCFLREKNHKAFYKWKWVHQVLLSYPCCQILWIDFPLFLFIKL